MREIPLTRGLVTIVDDEDYELLSEHKWCLRNGYAGRGYSPEPYKHGTIYMHRQILGFPCEQVDHINRAVLDNRRSNLRRADFTLNAMNKGVRPDSLTGIRGVSFDPDRGKFYARIRYYNQRQFLGRYDTAEEAAAVYQAAMAKYLERWESPS